MSRAWVLAVFVAIGGLPGTDNDPVITQSRPSALTARNGELFLWTESGFRLRSHELLGATLTLGRQKVRLDAVKRVSPPQGRHHTLHHFVRIDEDGGESEFCKVNLEGHYWALPLLDSQGRVYLACTAGAMGKCARWGYWPEDPLSRELHEACVRMVRADYGGDGMAATRNGTGIRFCDRAGIYPCGDDNRTVEAAWSRDGAVCVARTRISELMTLRQLETRYPRLQNRVGESACSIAVARNDPRAVLFSLIK